MFLPGRLFASRSPTSDFWYQPIGAVSASGVSVSPSSALRLSVIYACVRILAESVAKLPVRIRRGAFEVIAAHPLARVLSRRPNRWQTVFEFREMLQAHLSLRSNAYAQIVIDGRGEVESLIPLHPDRVTPEQLDDGTGRYRVRDARGRETVLLGPEVLHLRQLPLDGFLGLGVTAIQADGIGSALAAQQYTGKFFSNGAKHGGAWIEYPGKFADAEARAKFRDAFRAGLSGENAHSIPVLDQGMKMHELGMTNADAQFIESRKFNDYDLCRMMLVPPHKVGILDRSTNNNIEQQSAEFYQDTLMALFRRWEESLEGYLLTEAEQNDGLRIEFDVADLLRPDSVSRGKLYHDAILDGWMTRNEVRGREGLPPITGLDEPLEPLNMSRSSDPRDGAGGNARPAAEPDIEPDSPPKKRQPRAPSREATLLRMAADRSVTREVGALRRYAGAADGPERARAFYVEHGAYIAQALCMTPDASSGWCDERLGALLVSDNYPGLLNAWGEAGGAPLLEYAQCTT